MPGTVDAVTGQKQGSIAMDCTVSKQEHKPEPVNVLVSYAICRVTPDDLRQWIDAQRKGVAQ